MAQKLTANLPDSLDLDEKYTLRFTAIDPNNGSNITTVNISSIQIHCDNVAGTPIELLEVGPFQIVSGPSS